jgi:hypothetical protein
VIWLEDALAVLPGRDGPEIVADGVRQGDFGDQQAPPEVGQSEQTFEDDHDDEGREQAVPEISEYRESAPD